MAPIGPRKLAVVGVLLLVLVSQFGGPAGAQTASRPASIEEFTYSGAGSIETGQGDRYLWQSSDHSFDVVVDTGTSGEEVEICLGTTSREDADRGPLTCVAETLPSNSTVTATLSIEDWPANETGEQTATATITGPEGGPIDRSTRTVTVLEEDGDYDNDGVENSREVEEGTRVDSNDTDGDGLEDGQELDTYVTDPTKADTDGDGLGDRYEVDTAQTDPTDADTDGDGLTDDLEVNTHGTNPNKADTDGDGLDDNEEVNSYQTDPRVADTDEDALADAAEVREYGTDPNAQDTDGDGLLDGVEVHVYGTDPSKSDTDGDGLSDDDEVNRHRTDPTKADTDDDGLEDGPEIEIYETNPNRADTDGDGFDDGWEVQRGSDPSVPNPNQDAGLLGLAVQTWLPLLGGLIVLAVAAVGVVHYLDIDAAALLARGLGIESSATTDEASTGAAAEQGSDAAEEPGPEEPVLSKPDRVLQILDENDDRIRQSEIVRLTGWSKATVSRTLSKMAADGEITKINVGRGNVITRAGSEPENSGSPYDE